MANNEDIKDKNAAGLQESEHSPQNNGFIADFKRRVAENKPTRWVRFGIVSLIFFAWVIWMGNWWLALAWFLLFDIYITGYIPFTWWKRSKSATVRKVMSWVDAIVYALVLVYFIFAFVGQNYMIPTSSLEKTLLTGDYLWVNKLTYGPRVPMTPIHFPLVHNKFPIIGTKSYTDWPQNDYHRLKGLRNVEEFDIVVFNFPAGDTVATRTEEPNNAVTGRYYDQLVNQYGAKYVNDPKNRNLFGDIVYRPVDRRENYVKRCVGLPGDTFKIVNDVIYRNGKEQKMPESVQFNYIVALTGVISDDLAHEFGIARGDLSLISDVTGRRELARILGANPNNYFYMLPLTKGMIKALKDKGMLVKYIKYNDMPNAMTTEGMMYPYNYGKTWTISNWGGEEGVVIPRKGMTVTITPQTWDLYKRCIRNYEGHPKAEFYKGKLYLDGVKKGNGTTKYTFKMDYYFMMGDNRDNSLDSRFWGFVPEDHIVGTPVFVIASFDQDRSIFNGGFRWDRVFKDANPDK